MNYSIYIIDEDPSLCAGILSDQHVRSQLDEVSHVLVDALYRRGIQGPMLPTATDPAGRFAMWAEKDWDHFMWLVFYGLALVEEHDRRFGKMHDASTGIFAAGNLGHLLHDSQPQVPVEWPRSEDAEGYGQYDIFNAYQNVLRDKYEAWSDKNRAPTWTNTYPPNWLADTGEVLYTSD